MNCCDNKMKFNEHYGILAVKDNMEAVSVERSIWSQLLRLTQTNYKGAFIKIIQKLFLKKMRSYRN